MLKDKVFVITGGAGLLGKEFVKAIVQNNGLGVIADFNKELGSMAKQEINAELKTANTSFHFLDITSKDSINSLISALHEKHKRIDGLVNSAYPRNQNYGRPFEEVEYADFCKNVNMHLGGYFLTSQQFAKYFCQQGFGNIVNIASIYGVIPPRFEIYEGTNMTNPVEYAVIKAGIIHLTKYLAKYLKGKNIRVNSLSPGGILDKQSRVFIENYNRNCLNKGMLNKNDLIGSLLYLLSDMSKYLNGQNLIVDDGFTL